FERALHGRDGRRLAGALGPLDADVERPDHTLHGYLLTAGKSDGCSAASTSPSAARHLLYSTSRPSSSIALTSFWSARREPVTSTSVAFAAGKARLRASCRSLAARSSAGSAASSARVWSIAARKSGTSRGSSTASGGSACAPVRASVSRARCTRSRCPL